MESLSYADAFSHIWRQSEQLFLLLSGKWFWQFQMLRVLLRSMWWSCSKRDCNVLCMGLQHKPIQELMKKATAYLLRVITEREKLIWSCWAQKQRESGSHEGSSLSSSCYLLIGTRPNLPTDLKTVVHKSEPP